MGIYTTKYTSLTCLPLSILTLAPFSLSPLSHSFHRVLTHWSKIRTSLFRVCAARTLQKELYGSRYSESAPHAKSHRVLTHPLECEEL